VGILGITFCPRDFPEISAFFPHRHLGGVAVAFQ